MGDFGRVLGIIINDSLEDRHICLRVIPEASALRLHSCLYLRLVAVLDVPFSHVRSKASIQGSYVMLVAGYNVYYLPRLMSMSTPPELTLEKHARSFFLYE